jgi:hypothetical protein
MLLDHILGLHSESHDEVERGGEHRVHHEPFRRPLLLPSLEVPAPTRVLVHLFEHPLDTHPVVRPRVQQHDVIVGGSSVGEQLGERRR